MIVKQPIVVCCDTCEHCKRSAGRLWCNNYDAPDYFAQVEKDYKCSLWDWDEVEDDDD